ncbi:MAG: hypothetical protein NDI62_00445 [Burkholderiales bacterium]|nr:hypothetical protein [Burkholderiales bacterium]
MKVFFLKGAQLKGEKVLFCVKNFLKKFLEETKDKEFISGITPLSLEIVAGDTFLSYENSEIIFLGETKFFLKFYRRGALSGDMYLKVGPINPVDFINYFEINASFGTDCHDYIDHSDNVWDFIKVISEKLSKEIEKHPLQTPKK